MHVETYVRRFIPDRTTWPMRDESSYKRTFLQCNKTTHMLVLVTGDALLAFTRGHETRALPLKALRLCEPASLLALF